MSLGEIVDHLIEHPEQMYILPSREAAMVYYTPDESILVIEGDFSGDAVQCTNELRQGLSEFIVRDTAWMN